MHNAAALLRNGAVDARYHKCRLPNYGVFDERRYFMAGEDGRAVEIGETRAGPLGVRGRLARRPAVHRLRRRCPSSRTSTALRTTAGRPHEREDVLPDRASETGAWFVYVNTVGGQDELVFDGGSHGRSRPTDRSACRALRFEEDLLVVDDRRR